MSDAGNKPKLRGMTWNHPRGYDPLVACSAKWLEVTGVDIQWDRRSLQDFESYPVEQLARQYDLIVIDHPHVGQITGDGCLLPLDDENHAAELAELARGSVGPSFSTYTWLNRQWALPIDVAAQVQAWRPDLITAPATSWDDVLAMAGEGLVQLPMKPPHSLMSLYTLTANLGKPCRVGKETHVHEDAGIEAYDHLVKLTEHINLDCFQKDPIAILEAMANPVETIACVPLIYGYVSYSHSGFRPVRLRFGNIPTFGSGEPKGSALGGTGIAVSAYSSFPKEALDFSYWVASGPAQRDLYAASGGQPGHADAWNSTEVNSTTEDFYKQTRSTLESAWVRPRHNGYIPFQHWASTRLNQGLANRERADVVISDLNRGYSESF
ncbi:MAG: carbohydrate ABC transporter substrate-binding protein [Acidobacteria bacterium]|nr:carbohydrate ABC transporter substrate-binding protein [Acidobacteriota bacterium]